MIVRNLMLVAAAASVVAGSTQAQTERPDQTAFKAIYKELIEINTTLSVGSCTEAAAAMGRHLTRAGLPASDVRVLTPPDRPKDGNLVAVLRGTDPSARPVLLLAHIDVVEARREDWERDPFKLVEEGGYFYARGASDDKSMAAIFVDALVRYRAEGYRPRRDLKLALTCGEETAETHNGVEWLLANHREALDAAFAINEGGGGRLDAQGNRVLNGVQVGEKIYQDYQLETTNPGGHSSRPVKDNAIYDLTGAVSKIGAYDFPIEINPVTRTFFERSAAVEPAPAGPAMARMVAGGRLDTAAAAQVASLNPSWNSMMRTTCVATQLDAGHAPNALPQRARANVNCRILPGHNAQEVKADLERIIANPKVKVTLVGDESVTFRTPALTPSIIGPAEQLTRRMWGDRVPLIPMMSTGATDGRYLNAAGIPTYGVSGLFSDPDGGGIHGLNERIRVRSLYEGRDFLYELIKIYGSQAS